MTFSGITEFTQQESIEINLSLILTPFNTLTSTLLHPYQIVWFRFYYRSKQIVCVETTGTSNGSVVKILNVKMFIKISAGLVPNFLQWRIQDLVSGLALFHQYILQPNQKSNQWQVKQNGKVIDTVSGSEDRININYLYCYTGRLFHIESRF